MAELQRTITREELHRMVWSTPIQKLAEQYGLSDRGLAKICERHLVPPPPRGYWAKIQAGQSPKKPKLRSVDNTDLHIVHIGKNVRKPSTYVAQVLEAAEAALAEDDLAAAKASPPERISAPRTPPEPRCAIQRYEGPVSDLRGELLDLARELRAVAPDKRGAISFKWVFVSKPSVERVIAFLHNLLPRLTPFDIRLDASDSRLRFERGIATVDFEITETRKRVNPHSTDYWRRQETDFNGRLAFRVFGYGDGVRCNWGDGSSQTIESLVDSIVEGVRLHLAVQKERREKELAEQQRRAKLAHRREMVALRAKREEDRLAYLRWIANVRREADDLRETIAAVPQGEDLPPDYQRMIAWAQDRLAELEGQTAVEQIQSALVEQKLYTDPDHLFDPEGDPPPKKNYWDD